MRAQRVAVSLDAVEHDRRDREHHARRREFSLRQNVMDQAAVQTAVAVLERVDVDETEGGRRRLQHGVEFSLAHALVRGDHPLHQGLQILRARADEFRQRIALVIALAEENAVRPQARPREARVLDQHAMQAQDLVKRQRVLAGLQHGAAPPLQPAARRLLAFDLEAGAAVREQKETGRARDDIRAGAADDLVRLGCRARARRNPSAPSSCE